MKNKVLEVLLCVLVFAFLFACIAIPIAGRIVNYFTWCGILNIEPSVLGYLGWRL